LAHVIDAPGVRIDVQLIRCQGAVLIELERNDTPAEPITIQSYQRPMMIAPRDTDELTEYHQTLLKAIRDIAGFERIMIYRFQDDWAGEVIAELSTAGTGSYLGLRFPASDIPAIARNLYLVNASRMIPDSAATAVPVIGLTSEPPDMTRSDLRSVSPVHLQYLANMGVGASFSLPVRVSGRLWALVACHHRQPRTLSPDQRNACVMLAGAYALGLTTYLASRRLQMMDSLERRIDGVLEALSDHSDPLDGIEANGQRLIEALDAKGFAMAVGTDVVIAGEGPDIDGISIIDQWFLNDCKESVFSTDYLTSIFPAKVEILAAVSGMMAIKARSVRSGWVRFYWFRPAEPQEVAWAGNPNKPHIENAGVVALSPRRSFERWVETKSGYSRPWLNEEKLVAGKFRNNLLRWL
jgi:light-regulated signal transduction histidine kinase (bacteriophytochrome)